MSRIKVLETFTVLGLAAIIFYLITGNEWLVWTAGTLLLVAVFDNPAARFITKIWLGFSEVLGKVMSKLILSLVYYLFLFPIAMLNRLFSHEMTDHFYKRGKKSYFAELTKPYDKKSFESPW